MLRPYFGKHIYGWGPAILTILQSLKKFFPWILYKNPVIFITEIGAVWTLLEAYTDPAHFSFSLQISIWLWLTVLIANFSEAAAEVRNKAQAAALKKGKVETSARRLDAAGKESAIQSTELRKGDRILVRADEMIPGDGEIVRGMASIDESSVTGESEPVIRAAGTDRCSVTAGTKVLSDEIEIIISSNPGESFLDHMIALIEGSKRKKSTNEIALTILLSGLSFIFLFIVVTFKIFGFYFEIDISETVLIALLVCLMPTTIGGLLSAVGIAGVSRLMKKRVLAMSGQAVEAAGDVDLILFDKTGTITKGKREAVDIIPASVEMAHASFLTSFADQTTEGRSIIEWVKKTFPKIAYEEPCQANIIPFSASTRMSGIDIGADAYRKGAKAAIEEYVGKKASHDIEAAALVIAQQGGTPLLVATKDKILGVIFLKDVIKPGLAALFSRFREMGLKTVMMTGDNQITAGVIAKEVGVHDYLANVSPEAKLNYVKKMQDEGYLVAMTGDGVNDAPALAQADVGVAMNIGAQAAKEAANMIDLDSHPTKLFEIIEIGKQMLMTRGALTTFSIANDVAKYFVILPAILMGAYPEAAILNIMELSSPQNAILSAVIFNALIMLVLIPLALKGVKLLPYSALRILNRNLLIYGIGGVIVPFIGIKLIDLWLS